MPDNQLDREIGERLTIIVNTFYNGSSRKLALAFGIDTSRILKIQKGVGGLTIEKAVDISSVLNIDLNWLLSGEGEMIKEEKFELAEGHSSYLKKGTAMITVPEEELQLVKENLKRLQTIFESAVLPDQLSLPTEDLLDKEKNRSTGANKKGRKGSL